MHRIVQQFEYLRVNGCVRKQYCKAFNDEGSILIKKKGKEMSELTALYMIST